MLLIDRLRRLQQDLEQEVETLKARDAAENLAMEKLKASLTDAQWQMVEKMGFFELRSNTGHLWRIKTTHVVGNTFRYTGIAWKRYCAVLKAPPSDWCYPAWDQYLSQALMIRTDEVTYLLTAMPMG